jgi:hypothetical protein
MMLMADDDYDVGYCRPPKATQFKKGQSGNPHGRQPGSRNFETDLQEELRETLILREPGKRPRRVTKQRALIKRLYVNAAKGDPRAMTLLFNLLQRLKRDEALSDEPPVLTPDDDEILRSFLERQLSHDDGEAPE